MNKWIAILACVLAATTVHAEGMFSMTSSWTSDYDTMDYSEHRIIVGDT